MAKVEMKEDTSALDELSGGSDKESIKLPYMAINIASEDSDGKEIPVKTFTIVGTGKYSKTVKFRPLGMYNKLIAMKQDGTQWKVTNETIMFRKEQAIDARGGVGCGRLLGKAIPESWGDAEKKANRAKAQYYGFLFGYVEFPDSEPVLCNFRVPSGKAALIGNALAEYGKLKRKYHEHYLDLKLSTNAKDRSSPHPTLEVSIDTSKVLTSNAQLEKDAKLVLEFVSEHNARIRESHMNAKLARNEIKSDSALIAAIDEDEDTIPF